jgi:hypothetical protein
VPGSAARHFTRAPAAGGPQQDPPHDRRVTPGHLVPGVAGQYQQRLRRRAAVWSGPGGISLDGVPIDLHKIKMPSFLLSTRQDHIAPWRSTYAATQLYKGPVKFVLSAPGPYRRCDQSARQQNTDTGKRKEPPTPEEWEATATAVPDSWWPV